MAECGVPEDQLMPVSGGETIDVGPTRAGRFVEQRDDLPVMISEVCSAASLSCDDEFSDGAGYFFCAGI
jgi:hypothetical protein